MRLVISMLDFSVFFNLTKYFTILKKLKISCLNTFSLASAPTKFWFYSLPILIQRFSSHFLGVTFRHIGGYKVRSPLGQQVLNDHYKTIIHE